MPPGPPDPPLPSRARLALEEYVTGVLGHQRGMLSRVITLIESRRSEDRELAQRLLAETDHAIAQIAFACGFAHQEHLTRVFRQLSGATPARFRREARS